jgi:O-antigen ligase
MSVGIRFDARRPGESIPQHRPRRSPLLTLHRLLGLILILSAFVGLPRRMDFGGVSGLGTLTILRVMMLGAGVLAYARYPRSILARLLPYGCFLVWAALSPLWAPPSRDGFQNGVVYIEFGLALLLAGSLARRDAALMQHLLVKTTPWVDRITLALVFQDVVFKGLPNDPEEGWLIGPRPLAVLGLIMVSWHLSRWYYGSGRSRLLIALWMLAILFSMSRTGIAVCLVLVGTVVLLQTRFRPRHAAVTGPAFLAAVACTVGLVAYTSAFNDRFFAGADTQKVRVAGLAINTSGRINMWRVTIESARTSPLVGQGLGSSQELITAAYPKLGHPHNDYLRIWHDLGVVGLGLLLLSFLSWIYILWGAWYRAEKGRTRSAQLELTALLLLIALMMVIVPDNALVYSFIMGPTGVFVGAALGTASANAQPRRAPRRPITVPDVRAHPVAARGVHKAQTSPPSQR